MGTSAAPIDPKLEREKQSRTTDTMELPGNQLWLREKASDSLQITRFRAPGCLAAANASDGATPALSNTAGPQPPLHRVVGNVSPVSGGTGDNALIEGFIVQGPAGSDQENYRACHGAIS